MTASSKSRQENATRDRSALSLLCVRRGAGVCGKGREHGRGGGQQEVHAPSALSNSESSWSERDCSRPEFQGKGLGQPGCARPCRCSSPRHCSQPSDTVACFSKPLFHTSLCPRTGPRATDDVYKGCRCSPLSGYSGTVELTLPSQKSASGRRFRRVLITKICCFLWHVGRSFKRSRT